jgi:AAA+ superfamily predicted ATPase
MPVSSALVRLNVDVSLDKVVLQPSSRRELRQVVHEWQNRDRLRDHGLTPRSRLLFHGPPGCGKSLTARALARELGLPAYLVRFDAVIGAYLGQTAIHLRQLFHFAETTSCVLLLDELDALGKRRGNPLDVGELDRIVIALMQELEHSQPSGIIVGTSNMATHLDDALWRRFDLAQKFPAPRPATLKVYARELARTYKITLSQSLARRAARASSFAASEALIRAAARDKVLGRA